MLQPINSILVPIDDSTPGFQAAEMAYTIARSVGASLTLIHIHIREKALRELVIVSARDLVDLNEGHFDALMHTIVGDPSPGALHTAADHSIVEMDECTYDPSDEIVGYAKDNSIDLIVMGSRIHSRIENVLLGNVSSEVLEKAPCPVTIVH